MVSVSPLMNTASPEARNTAAAATSSGLPEPGCAGISGSGLTHAQLAGLTHPHANIGLSVARTNGIAADPRVSIHEGHILSQSHNAEFGGRIGAAAPARTQPG